MINEVDQAVEAVARPKCKPKKPMTLRRQVKRLAVLIGVTYLLLCGLGCVWPEAVLFHPHASAYQDGPEITKLQTADGVQISAMYLPAPAARYTILYSHGNAEDLGNVSAHLYDLRRLGFAVLGYDYHGYGTSAGRATEQNCYADIDAAYEYLTGTLKVPPERIIVHGRSIGSGPAVYLAARQAAAGLPVAGLIIESGFTTAYSCVWVGNLVPADAFRNINRIGQVKCPVLVMHGRDDGIVPFRLGRQLFEAAHEPKQCLWIDGAGHNDFSAVAGERYDQAIAEFVESLEKQGTP